MKVIGRRPTIEHDRDRLARVSHFAGNFARHLTGRMQRTLHIRPLEHLPGSGALGHRFEPFLDAFSQLGEIHVVSVAQTDCFDVRR